MIALDKLFLIIFDDERITDDRMDIFSNDFKDRLITYDSAHAYTSMINSTKAVLLNFEGKKTSKSETTSDRISSTVTVETYRSQFIELTRKTEANVRTLYNKKSAVYKEIFTKSLTYYGKPAVSKIPDFIDHFIARLTAHSELSSDLLTKFTDLKASFGGARSTQVTKKDTVKNLQVAISDERKALNLQMTQNVLQLAHDFAGKPDFAKVFFDTTLLFDHPHKAITQANTDVKLTVKALQTRNTGLKGIEGRTLRVINMTLAKLQIFSVAKTKDVTPGEKSVFVDPEGDITFTMDKVGDPTNKYLKIKNLNDTAAQLIFMFLD